MIKRAQPEKKLQKAIVDYIRLVAPQVLVFAIPNRAIRFSGAKASNAIPGLLAGIPDLCIVIPGGKTHFIEVKYGKGNLSSNQENIIAWLILNDVCYCIARSIDDVRVALVAWGIPTKEGGSGRDDSRPRKCNV